MLDVQVVNERQVLVVAGDYEIVRSVREALRGRGFNVHSAFSHQDATYLLRQGRHDVALVDLAMQDRRTGETTLRALASQSLHPPLVAIALNGNGHDGGAAEPDAETQSAVETMITSIDEESIQRGLMKALRMPSLQPVAARRDDSPEAEGPRQRAEELRTLFALGRSLTEVLNLSEVLNRIVEAARRLTNAEEGMILLPDASTGELWLRARVGIDVEVARNFRVKTQDTLAGSVFKGGKPLLIGEQGPQKVKTEYFVNSLLYVPILLRGMPIGVLGVNNKQKHDVFDLRHQELLVNLASYAAIAIENARIHEESVKQARELRALVDASQVVNSSVALERTLPNICEQLIRVLNVSRSQVLEWDRAGNRLRTLAHYDHTFWRQGHEPVIDLASRPALKLALENNRYFMVTRHGTGVIGESAVLEAAGVGAMLVLPVMANRAPVGVVVLYYVHVPALQPDLDDLKRAQRIGLQLLAQLTDTAHGSNPAHFRLALELVSALKADWCDCALLASDEKHLLLRLTAGQGLWLSAPYPTLDLTAFPHLRDALARGDEIRYADDGTEAASLPEGASELLRWARSRSLLGLPLVTRGQTQGLFLFADSEQSGTFDAHEIDLARAIVGQASTALENARLVHDLEASLNELKETQGRLIQAARLSAMGELAAAVAHQVNNPLTTIVLDTELMLLSEPENSPRREALAAIVRAGKRAAGVVRRLLTAARQTDFEARMEPVNVVSTIEEVVALVKSHIQRDKVKLIARLPDYEVPPVLATPGQLDDVWLNLLLNAHDALRGRPEPQIGIELSYTPSSDHMQVVVWDNGPGIPDEVMGEIFKPFFTTKPLGEGTGLGLHIVRQVIDRVGGTISVESKPDEGTRFMVRLPVKRGT